MTKGPANPALIIMAKWPEPGQVKTRLCPPLGKEEAADLYRAMLEDVLAAAVGLPDYQVVLGFYPLEREPDFRQLAGEDVLLIVQEGADLAARMQHCFGQVFARGFAPVLMRNSDAPTLPAHVIAEALDELVAGAAAVFSPDASNGFGLMGLAGPSPQLLKEPLATENSYQEILKRCETEGLSAESVTGWYDVDTPRDLVRLLSECEAGKVPARTAAFLSEGNRAAEWKARLMTG